MQDRLFGYKFCENKGGKIIFESLEDIDGQYIAKNAKKFRIYERSFAEDERILGILTSSEKKGKSVSGAKEGELINL